MTGILALASDRADLGGPFLETPPSSFGERFGAAWNEATAPDRWFNVEGARRDKYQAVIDALHTATGKTYENPLAYVPGAGSAGPDGQVIDPVAVRQQRIQTLIQAHAEATRDVGADIPDPNLVEQQIHEEGQGARNKAASLVGTGNGLGAFFGAAAAPTPENLAGFLIPPSKLLFGAMPVARGFLATVGREALYQGAANAALTGASDLADVATGVKQMSDLPGDVAGAALAGGAFGAAFHTPKALWDHWNGLPQSVRDAAPLATKDAFNVIEREVLFGGGLSEQDIARLPELWRNAYKQQMEQFGGDPVAREQAQAQAVSDLIQKPPAQEGASLPTPPTTTPQVTGSEQPQTFDQRMAAERDAVWADKSIVGRIHQGVTRNEQFVTDTARERLMRRDAADAITEATTDMGLPEEAIPEVARYYRPQEGEASYDSFHRAVDRWMTVEEAKAVRLFGDDQANSDAEELFNSLKSAPILEEAFARLDEHYAGKPKELPSDEDIPISFEAGAPTATGRTPQARAPEGRQGQEVGAQLGSRSEVSGQPEVGQLLKGEHAAETRTALLGEHEQVTRDAAAVEACLAKGGSA